VDFIGSEESYPGYTIVQGEIDEQEVMQNFNPHVTFGNMGRAMMTLFNMATLNEWSEIVRPVMLVQPFMAFFFLLYAIFVCFGVMNVIIGMIVDAVMQNARALEREVEQSKKKDKLALLTELKEIIFNLDDDGDQQVDREELENHMASDPRLRQVLSKIALPIGCSGAEFFSMLDNDGDGHLEPHEFISNLYRLINCGGFQQTCMMLMGLNDIKFALNESSEKLNRLSAAMSSLTGKVDHEFQLHTPMNGSRMSPKSDMTQRSRVSAANLAFQDVDAVDIRPGSAVTRACDEEKGFVQPYEEEMCSILNSVSAKVGAHVQSQVRQELFAQLDMLRKKVLDTDRCEDCGKGSWEPLQSNDHFHHSVAAPNSDRQVSSVNHRVSPTSKTAVLTSPKPLAPVEPKSEEEGHDEVHPFEVLSTEDSAKDLEPPSPDDLCLLDK
jgi:hypothetical protein